jgi:hypothetical protein
MPVLPVKDLKIHPRDLDLIVGTYGRGAYILDVSLLSQLEAADPANIQLYKINHEYQQNFSERAYWGNYEFTGDNQILTPNEPNVVSIYSYSPFSEIQSGTLTIEGENYEDILEIKLEKGFNKIIYPSIKLNPGMYKARLEIGDRKAESDFVIKKTPVWPVGKLN